MKKLSKALAVLLAFLLMWLSAAVSAEGGPSEEPAAPPAEEPETPPEEPVDPPETPTDPPETPTDPPEPPTDPPETPTDPPETPTDPPEAPTDPPETPTDPPAAPTDPPASETPAPTKKPKATKTPPAQTESPDPEPVITPEPAEQPTPTAEPAPTKKPGKTAAPTDTPVPTEEPDETPEPEKTPKPTKTPKPKKTPKPRKTPKPSDEPDPEETPVLPDDTDDPGELPTMPVPTEKPVDPRYTPVPTPYPRVYTGKTPDETADANLVGQWQGKDLLSFGDSIMYGAGAGGSGPAVQFARRYGMNLTDYSRNGAFMTQRYVRRSVLLIINQVDKAISEHAPADLIFLQGGCNDLYAGMTLGAVETDGIVGFDASTYAGAIEYCVTKLRAAYPDAVIVFLRPHYIPILNGNMQLQTGDVIEEICAKWGLLYADVYGNMLSEDGQPSAQLKDHPTRNEYKEYYIDSMENALRQPVPTGWAEP